MGRVASNVHLDLHHCTAAARRRAGSVGDEDSPRRRAGLAASSRSQRRAPAPYTALGGSHHTVRPLARLGVEREGVVGLPVAVSYARAALAADVEAPGGPAIWCRSADRAGGLICRLALGAGLAQGRARPATAPTRPRARLRGGADGSEAVAGGRAQRPTRRRRTSRITLPLPLVCR